MMMQVAISLAVGMLIGGCVAYLFTARRLRISSARVSIADKRVQAAERLAEIGSMTGGLAHEIKNPLSTIGLNAQLLSEAIEDLPVEEQDRSRLIRRIDALGRETERLKGILEDFLEYAGELRLTFVECPINTIVEELADFFSPMAEGAGVRLRVETDPSMPKASVDADHLKQAMLNLMLNAVHAMENDATASGELILRVRSESDLTDGDRVCIHVIDTGPGMDELTKSKIFRPYFTTKSGGSGLGLPTSRRIVEAHQGQLEFHSESGKGTDFVLVIPVRQHSETEIESETDLVN